MKKRMLAIMMSALMAAGICSGVTVYADACLTDNLCL